jgi:hypothetical protein
MIIVNISPDSSCSDGAVQPLRGGSSESEGFIEVCSGGEFQLVSPQDFTISEANVICRELTESTGK